MSEGVMIQAVRGLVDRHLARGGAGVPRILRQDGWLNVVTGLGNAVADKVVNTQPTAFQGLNDQALSAMFHSDATVRKICYLRPQAALRHGVQVSIPDDVELATGVQDDFDRLEAGPKMLEACTWENLFGGCVVYMGVDDGQSAVDSQAQPLDLKRVRKVLWLKVVDKRYVTPATEKLDLDPTSPTFGEPTHYRISVTHTNQHTAYVEVHRSRLIVFPGMTTTVEERWRRAGWGISALDPVYDALQRHISAWQSAANAMSNAQYVVYKLKGLAHMLGMPGGEAKAKERSRAMELAKSMINAVLIDEGDEYERENPNFGNMPELLEMFMYDVVCAVDMPVTRLFGRSPQGMNATGESDREQWHETVEDDRERQRPKWHQLVSVLLAAKEGPAKGREPDGWRVTFKPLEQLSEVEWADVRLKQAQADKAYVEAEILLPSEVASSRFRAEGWSAETKIDLETREMLRESELAALQDRIENPPEKQALELKAKQGEQQSAGKQKPPAK